MRTIIKVTGMSCAGCRASVENALRRVAGVSAVSVSLEKGEAAVEFDEGKVSAERLKAAVEKAGYKAS